MSDPVLTYWRNVAEASESRINAACEAVGVAGFYLGPYCALSEADRLDSLRDVLTDLQRALGLSADPDLDTDVPQPKGREY